MKLKCCFILCLFLSFVCYSLCMPQGDLLEKQCSDYDEFGYFCVPYYQCDAQNLIITDGGDLFDPRQAGDDCGTEPDPVLAMISKCGKLLEVCCKHPQHEPLEKCRTNRDDGDIFGGDVEGDIFGGDVDGDIFGGDVEGDIFGGDGEGDIFGGDGEDETNRADDGDIFGGDGEDDVFGGDNNDLFGKGPATGSPAQCGKRNNKGFTQTSNLKSYVEQAKFGEWPHVCAVLTEEYFDENEPLVTVYQCGASLIADGVVLTAGHCLNNTDSLSNKLVVRCGEWDTQSKDEDLPFQEQEVVKIEMHPDINMNNHHNNFALLFLDSPFSRSSIISPVCLPKPGVVFSEQNCFSHGWGKDKFGAEGRYSKILKEVVVPLVENKKCQKLLRENTRLGQFFELDSSFICAGGEKDIDTCKGDGGSPLTCKQPDGPWVQAGIVSWGIGCGENNTPAVYANVAQASCWIDNAVKCYLGQSESFFGFPKAECSQFNEYYKC